MKPFGQSLKDLFFEKWSTKQLGWEGRQSKKISQRRKRDKKQMHRHARHILKNELKKEQNV